MIRLLHLTDPHISADSTRDLHGINCQHSFLYLLNESVKQVHPDYIIITGDISQDQSRSSYSWLRSVMNDTGIAWSWLPGNHDVLNWMQPEFRREIYVGPWRLLQLNSRVEGHSYGALSDNELSFLTKVLLQNTVSPTLLTMHHHVCKIGSCLDDGRIDSYRLFRLLRNFPCVKAIVHGHIHQFWDSTLHNIRILGTPSTCVQFLPESSEFLLDYDNNPGYRILYLYPDNQIDTEIRRIKEDCFIPRATEPFFLTGTEHTPEK